MRAFRDSFAKMPLRFGGKARRRKMNQISTVRMACKVAMGRSQPLSYSACTALRISA